jgi:uncharacterized protein YndB with AHSA1/START domain
MSGASIGADQRNRRPPVERQPIYRGGVDEPEVEVPGGRAVRWRLHLASPPSAVFDRLATDSGRATFWAESAIETDGFVDFQFPGGETWRGRILDRVVDRRFQIEYFGGTITTFELAPDGEGGTELTLVDRGVADPDRAEVAAGWVSVLTALKAAADFGVDLRNHRVDRSWRHGFADN